MPISLYSANFNSYNPVSYTHLAVYDEEGNSEIQGDDTGDNISKLRMSFCAFTVQYWAWQNVDADYYGCLLYTSRCV